MVNEEVQEHEAAEQSAKFLAWLKDHDACDDSLEWLQGRTARQAWDECERADWLLWWAAKSEVDRRLLVRVACQCARRALRFVPEAELRPLQAIETAEAWCEGKATIEEVLKAAYAAFAAVYTSATAAAYALAAANAAYAAASAGYSDKDEADEDQDKDEADAAAASASFAADAAYNAAADIYSAYAARRAEHIAMCSIVRQYIPFEAVWHG